MAEQDLFDLQMTLLEMQASICRIEAKLDSSASPPSDTKDAKSLFYMAELARQKALEDLAAERKLR